MKLWMSSSSPLDAAPWEYPGVVTSVSLEGQQVLQRVTHTACRLTYDPAPRYGALDHTGMWVSLGTLFSKQVTGQTAAGVETVFLGIWSWKTASSLVFENIVYVPIKLRLRCLIVGFFSVVVEIYIYLVSLKVSTVIDLFFTFNFFTVINFILWTQFWKKKKILFPGGHRRFCDTLAGLMGNEN